jgi:hypothetical protein
MFRLLKGHFQVFLLTYYYINGLQREIPIFLFAYTGHQMATLVFICLQFRDIDSTETKLLNLTTKLKLF